MRRAIAGLLTAGTGLALWNALRRRRAAGTAESEPEPAPDLAPAAASPAGPVQSDVPPVQPEAAGAEDAPRTRKELYERAQQLGIEGRSKMSKDELRRAIADRG